MKEEKINQMQENRRKNTMGRIVKTRRIKLRE